MRFLTDFSDKAAAPRRGLRRKPLKIHGSLLISSALSASAAFAASGAAKQPEPKPGFLIYGRIKNESVLVKKALKRPGFSEFVTDDGKILIKEKKLSRKQFLDWIRQDKFIFMSQFEPSSSPYAGALSNQIGCAKSLRPRPVFPKGKKPAPVIEAIAYQSNSRFVALSCAGAGEPAHDSAYIAIHCSAGAGYKIAIHKKTAAAGKALKSPGMAETAAAFLCQPQPAGAAKKPA